jgi:protein-disulfide isomerase
MKRPILLLAAAAALALGGCQKPDDAQFGARVRAYLLEHPEVLTEAMVKLREKEQLKQETAAKAAVQKFRAQLERDPRDFVANPNGEFTVVEFFDYNCAYCKLAAPEVVKLIEQNPDVRFVFKEFAFQTEYSVAAAKLALTPAAKPNGLAFYKALMSQKPLDGAAIERSLKAAGIDADAAHSAAADPAIEKQISDAHELAGQLGIDGTPAFVVGDQLINGADLPALRAAIAKMRAGAMKRPTANPA